MQVLDQQGLQLRYNASDGATLTNTSFLQNGQANGAFNAGLMDTANIGVTAAFPY